MLEAKESQEETSRESFQESCSHNITTERLVLRPMVESDRALFLALHTNPKIMRHNAPTYSEEYANRAFSHTLKLMAKEQPDILVWVVWLKQQPLGLVTLYSLQLSQQTSDVGVILLEQAWGQGIATEALQALVHSAFTQLNLARLSAGYRICNQASVGVCANLGFIPVQTNLETEQCQLTKDIWLQNS